MHLKNLKRFRVKLAKILLETRSVYDSLEASQKELDRQDAQYGFVKDEELLEDVYTEIGVLSETRKMLLWAFEHIDETIESNR